MFNERLRFLREIAGMTQAELAKKIDVAATTYRNYENTSREPNYETLIKIANTLDVSIDYLLGVQSQQTKNERLMHAISKLPDDEMVQLYDYVNYLTFKARTKKVSSNKKIL